jgi:hypothetical protein
MIPLQRALRGRRGGLDDTHVAPRALGEAERQAVLDAARLRGIAPGTRARRLLDTWLVARPSEDYFTSALLALKEMLPDLPADVQAATKHDLVAYCMFLDRAALDVHARQAIVGALRRSTLQCRAGGARQGGSRKEVG